jgi:DNA polymerase III sliding clamp (beta) subunit (PCNA family)
MNRPMSTTPPQTERVVLDAQTGRTFTVALNASYLKDIAEALGSDELLLSFRSPDSSILVRPVGEEDGSLGLLAAIHIKD